MSDRRRTFRQPCELIGHIYMPHSDAFSNECQILDISSHGAFLRPSPNAQLPPTFDLVIGDSNTARPCRLARINSEGFGVEFLDPVRTEIEKALMEAAFEEEILFDLIAGVSIDASTSVARLRRAVAAMMDIVEKRNEMTWQQSTAA
ncbi:PilZ domain-containing protein [Methylobacterium iners]|uniref:PilZ domain-containing protein n=1 Tax=Methylobacterium iners TaxID=418707 RepID=UPI0024B4924F|nr:PilZ domain-containing protein [Methylobacterium iners]